MFIVNQLLECGNIYLIRYLDLTTYKNKSIDEIVIIVCIVLYKPFLNFLALSQPVEQGIFSGIIDFSEFFHFFIHIFMAYWLLFLYSSQSWLLLK